MKTKSQLSEYLFILVGTIFLSLGTVVFLSPNEIITGGGIGMALLMHALFPSVTLGMYIAIISLPFIVLGFFYFGSHYTYKTFFTMLLLSVLTDFFKEVLQLGAITHDILLASIFGGIFIGLGVGLIIKGRSSTGSTSVIGDIVARKTKYKAAEVLLLIDALIIFASIFVYGAVDKSLYSMLGVYVTSRVIDMILTGRPSKKIVNIVSENVELLKEHIREKIEEHGTIVSGVGLHSDHQRKIIFVTVEAGKIQLLRDLIAEHDPEAFLVITEASEILGRGH